MTDWVECNAFLGGSKHVPKEKLTFRPSAYGIIINEGRILLVKNRSTGTYSFPGGGIEIGERIANAIQREVREETGIEISVEKNLGFSEQFFYYDPLDVAFHSFMFFYRCKPKTFDLIADELVDDLESEKPRWIKIEQLTESDMQMPEFLSWIKIAQ
jgi:8-oxo-dGTP diphosphatase